MNSISLDNIISTNSVFEKENRDDFYFGEKLLSLYNRYFQNIDNQLTNEFKNHLKILFGITFELKELRDNFVETGNLINLFPTAYFHTTYLKLEQILDGVYDFPIEKIKQIQYFYYAYRYNRNLWESGEKNLVENHWKRHFEQCEHKISKYDFKKYLGYIIATGIEAHVEYDLARALQFSIKNRHNTSLSEEEFLKEISREFFKTEVIFPKVTERTNADICKAGLCSKIWLDLFTKSFGRKITKIFISPFSKQNIFTDLDVIEKRNQILEKINQENFYGIYGELLINQPIIDTEVLLEKGNLLIKF